MIKMGLLKGKNKVSASFLGYLNKREKWFMTFFEKTFDWDSPSILERGLSNNIDLKFLPWMAIYSYFKLFTGFSDAVLHVCEAIIKSPRPAIIETPNNTNHSVMFILYA